jgi:hypothetical protein
MKKKKITGELVVWKEREEKNRRRKIYLCVMVKIKQLVKGTELK